MGFSILLVNMNTDFWLNKTVLVTGHTGFKGSWLSLWLQQLGANVIGYSLKPPTWPNLYHEAQVGRGLVCIEGDVRDLRHLQEAMETHRPEVVFHLAGQSLVRHSYKYPVETFDINVMGTVNVLESIRHNDCVRSAVMVTTDKCYENREWAWGYRENDSLGGREPYSGSKSCAELAIAAYRDAYFNAETYAVHGTAIASARAGNVIGGGDWAQDRLIPDFIRAIADGKPIHLRNPNAIRPWQHVLEPLRGYLVLAQKLYQQGSTFAQTWNFGPDYADARPVRWIVERLTELWGQDISWAADKGDHPHEATYLRLDCSKAKAHLNWYPKLSLLETLASIAEFYKAYFAGENIRAVVQHQIQNYQKEFI